VGVEIPGSGDRPRKGAADAIVLTGAVGVGKTTVLIEIGELLEPGPEPYALIDLDWLAWLRPAAGSTVTVTGVLCENLRHVAATFRTAGIRRIALSRAACEPTELEGIRVALGADRVTVVRLTAAPSVIERRLRARNHGGRLTQHLREARAFTAAAEAAGIGDLVLRTDDADATAVARAAMIHAEWISCP
jgi:adenylylsulfate kinase